MLDVAACCKIRSSKPMTRRLHFHGTSSSRETGVWPNCSRNFLDGFFFRFFTVPQSITTSCFVGGAGDAD